MKAKKREKLSERQRKLRKKKIRKRRRRRAAVLLIELLLVGVLGTAVFAMFKLDKLNWNSLGDVVNNGIEREGYTNIALFGTDNRKGETSGVRSDCIIVASIDNSTNEVRLLSVYRDTMLMQEDGYFNKANSAYAMGGPAEAVNMLNRNMDLDITDYVSVNFLALADVVDLLGGIEIDMTYEEVCHMNNYCVETSEITGKDYTRIEPEEAGTYLLNGVQAVSYSRIRYTAGGDMERTQRQRLVIEKIVEKAKAAKLSTLNEIIDTVLPQVSTSFTASEILKLAAGALNYTIGDSQGFPSEAEDAENVPGYTEYYLVPAGLERNVILAHEFLYPGESYTPTETVSSISSDLAEMTGIYPWESAESETAEGTGEETGYE